MDVRKCTQAEREGGNAVFIFQGVKILKGSALGGHSHNPLYTLRLSHKFPVGPKSSDSQDNFHMQGEGVSGDAVVWEWVCEVGRQSLFTQSFDAFLHLLPVCRAAIHPIIIRRFVRQHFALFIFFALYSSSHRCHTWSLLILICKKRSRLLEWQRVRLRCLWCCIGCCNVFSCLHTKRESQMGSFNSDCRSHTNV